MRLYRVLSDYKGSSRGIALAIGNFDGFHVGHQAVVAAMREKAARFGLESAVMIFEPQPLEYFGRAVPARLSTLRDKLRFFRDAGVEIVFCMPFRRKFSSLEPRAFVCDLLRDQLQVRSITVGSLFTFGRCGAAGIRELTEIAASAGMEAGAIAGVAQNGVRVSSTIIRTLLEQGDLEGARCMIGRPYSMSGRVINGNRLGRNIGFPTANINLNRKVCPLKGVYAVRVQTPFGLFDGMANVGSRPTVGNLTRPLLEVHIFDFNQDLYGKEVEVRFIKKIRDEQRFSDLNALIAQLQQARHLIELELAGVSDFE